jgi:hypothetical protein
MPLLEGVALICRSQPARRPEPNRPLLAYGRSLWAEHRCRRANAPACPGMPIIVGLLDHYTRSLLSNIRSLLGQRSCSLALAYEKHTWPLDASVPT